MDLSPESLTRLLPPGASLPKAMGSAKTRRPQRPGTDEDERIADYLQTLVSCEHILINVSRDFQHVTALGQKLRQHVSPDFKTSVEGPILDMSFDEANAAYSEMAARDPTLNFEIEEMWTEVSRNTPGASNDAKSHTKSTGFATVYTHMIVRGWDQLHETEIKALGLYDFRLNSKGTWEMWRFNGMRRGMALDGGT